MAQATFHFPRGFLWGTATSSHQVEGNNTANNWYAWEKLQGRIVQEQKSGFACDWWGGRWREDLDRAAEAGQNSHRMSIEWSRIQPAADRWDEPALDRYREIMRGMFERNLLPLITLQHFTLPLWLSEQGGWENDRIVEYFAAYAGKVVEALKEYASLWVTINEPNVVMASAYVLGDFPPGKQDLFAALRAGRNMLRAHAAAYQAIHKIQPQSRVGIAVNYRAFAPAKSWSPLDQWAARTQSQMFNDFFPKALQTGKIYYPLGFERIQEAVGTQDFIGVNYYTRDQVAFNLLKPGEFFARRYFLPGADLSDTGFIANVPAGMFDALHWSLQFKIPIIVTENGVEDADDDLRPRYILQHLHQVWRAVNFNYPIKGYYYWTLVDNFEWERGWTQRFGLWELDVDTQARRKRPSADLYAEICRENGISSEMVERYAPEILNGMFPD